MAHKTTELKFNQVKEEMDLWLSGIGFWGSSNYRLHKLIWEYNTDNLGCAMAVILNVFSCYFVLMGAVVQTWSLLFQPMKRDLLATITVCEFK